MLKFSQETLTILKNYMTINPSVLFEEGCRVRTISPWDSIYASAEIKETIPQTFAIHNLSQFISVLSLFDNPVIEVEDNRLLIGEQDREGKQVRYMFAQSTTIKCPPKNDLTAPTSEAVFNLTENTLTSLKKTANILELPNVAIVGKNGKVTVEAINAKDATTNTFSVDVGLSDQNFRAIFEVSNLLLMSDDYTVTLSWSGQVPLAEFKGPRVRYVVPVESTSKFN